MLCAEGEAASADDEGVACVRLFVLPLVTVRRRVVVCVVARITRSTTWRCWSGSGRPRPRSAGVPRWQGVDDLRQFRRASRYREGVARGDNYVFELKGHGQNRKCKTYISYQCTLHFALCIMSMQRNRKCNYVHTIHGDIMTLCMHNTAQS